MQYFIAQFLLIDHYRWKKPELIKSLRIMKLTSILLTIFSLQVGARGLSQTITLSLKNAHLKEVFSEIQKQSSYMFAYNKSILDKATPININVENAEIKNVLQIIFEDQPITYVIDGRIIILKSMEEKKISSNYSKEFDSEIKGKVLNEQGEPLSEVTITIKGTTTSLITDANGEFTFGNLSRNTILVFSHVSMEIYELKVNGRSNITVTLRPKISTLSDVQVTVNTGYQQIPKERATGSFSFVDNQTVNQQVGTNILKRLDGVTSGLYFNVGKNNNGQGNTNILIRGLSTINGPIDPLIVLDGFIYDGDINNINPNDVENISVLKDAAATSIWGARAGNGVIVITTKKGKFNQKIQVSFNSNLIVSEKPDLFNLPQISPADYIDFEQELFRKGYFNSSITNINRPPLTPAVEIFLRRRNNQITAEDSATQISRLKNIDSRSQYEKHFYRNPVTQQYSINLRGGSQINSYTFSVGYDRNTSELYNKFNKLNIRVQNTLRPIKNLDIDLNVYYTKSENSSGRPGYNQILIGSRQVPYLGFADENGTPLSVASRYRSGYIDTAGAGKLLNWKYYPLEDYKYSRNLVKLNELFSSLGLQYRVRRDVNVELKYQYQKQENLGDLYHSPESFTARDFVNLYSQLNRATGIVNYIIPKGGVKIVSNGVLQSHTLRGQLNINPSWDRHEINAIVGSEVRQSNDNGSTYRYYGYKTDPLSYGNIDYVNRYPTFIRGLLSTIPGSPTAYNRTSRFISAYAIASYTFDGKYTVSLNARRDGSNIFGVNTNDKWRPLWSSGIAWQISKEKFYKSNFVPYLKLRTTYGYSGNVDLRKSAVPVATVSFDSDLGLPYARVNSLNDPSLRWEKVGQFNVGMDFGLKKNIISGSVDFYKKYSSDLYAPAPYDYTAWGVSYTIIQNIANTEGTGVDIILNSRNIDKNIKWNTTFFFNYNTSKTTKYYLTGSDNVINLLGAGGGIYPIIGKPLYAISAYKWGGLDASGNPQGFVNGQLSTDYYAISEEGNNKNINGNIVYKGPANPPIFGSIINSVSWKGFSLAINMMYKFGYYFNKSSISYDALINSGAGHSDYSNRWQKSGDEKNTNVPSFVYPNIDGRDAFYLNSEVNVLRADHIRLQYVNLSYSFNKNNAKRSLIGDYQLYVNASNLGIIWRANNEDLDPEYSNSLAPLKTIAVGFRANF